MVDSGWLDSEAQSRVAGTAYYANLRYTQSMGELYGVSPFALWYGEEARKNQRQIPGYIPSSGASSTQSNSDGTQSWWGNFVSWLSSGVSAVGDFFSSVGSWIAKLGVSAWNMIGSGITWLGEKMGLVDIPFKVDEGNNSGYVLVGANALAHPNTAVIPYRPDKDGYLTFQEARNWYKYAKGAPLCVLMSKLDFSTLSLSDFDENGKALFDFYGNNFHDGLVHGKIELRLLENNQAEIWDTRGFEMYDFDMKSPWAGNTLRNVYTLLYSAVNGYGTPYRIYYQGKITVNP